MVTTRDVEYSADGTVMVGRLALPDGSAKRPAVLIAHEGPGLDDEQRGRAQQLAELGYIAFALDYHGGGRWLSDRDEMMTRLGVLGADPERTRELARAGLGVLLSEPRADGSNVAAIGYCFGGTVALELARSGAALKAVVGFHPGLSTVRPEDAGNIGGRVLVFVGTEDPFIPLEQRLAFEAEMRAGGVDWEMILYGGAEHSFTHPAADPEVTGLPGIKYHPKAAERSWRAMLELFDEVFG
jgi:dienelactone hydrolase